MVEGPQHCRWIIIGRRLEGSYDWDTSSYNQRWLLHRSLQTITKAPILRDIIASLGGSIYLVGSPGKACAMIDAPVMCSVPSHPHAICTAVTQRSGRMSRILLGLASVMMLVSTESMACYLTEQFCTLKDIVNGVGVVFPAPWRQHWQRSLPLSKWGRPAHDRARFGGHRRWRVCGRCIPCLPCELQGMPAQQYSPLLPASTGSALMYTYLTFAILMRRVMLEVGKTFLGTGSPDVVH